MVRKRLFMTPDVTPRLFVRLVLQTTLMYETALD